LGDQADSGKAAVKRAPRTWETIIPGGSPKLITSPRRLALSSEAAIGLHNPHSACDGGTIGQVKLSDDPRFTRIQRPAHFTM
jgi:hypothetical protein